MGVALYSVSLRRGSAEAWTLVSQPPDNALTDPEGKHTRPGLTLCSLTRSAGNQ